MVLNIVIVLFIGIGFINTLITIYFLRKENALRNRGERDEIVKGVNDSGEKGSPGKGPVYESVAHVKMAKGDGWSGYRYVL
jgi:hypothetical protein